MTNDTFTNKSFLILLFNANDLKNHVNEFQTVLQNKRIYIVLITETPHPKFLDAFSRLQTIKI